jgi:hypothetical protein
MLTVVVLPAPFGPSRAKIELAAMSRSRPSSTTVWPYALRKPRALIAGWRDMSGLLIGWLVPRGAG